MDCKDSIILVGSNGFIQRKLENYFKFTHKTHSLSYDLLSTYCEESDLRRKLLGSDIIVTPICYSVSDSMVNEGETFRNEVFPLVYLLNYLRLNKFKNRVLMIGSGEEYGQDANKSTAKELTSPLNMYSLAKMCESHFFQLFIRSFGLDGIILRTFNEIGPEQDSRFVVQQIIQQGIEISLKGESKIFRVGNPYVKRNFTDVRDVITAVDLVLKFGKTGKVYDVASEKSYSIKEIIELVSDILKISPMLEVDPYKLRSNDPVNLCPNIKNIQIDTGWVREYSIQETLKDIISYKIKKESLQK